MKKTGILLLFLGLLCGQTLFAVQNIRLVVNCETSEKKTTTGKKGKII